MDLPDGEVSWTVLDDEFSVVRPVERFLAHLSAVDRSPQTVRSYAFDLRDLFAFLLQAGLAWDALRLEDLGQFVAWLSRSPSERSGNVTRLPQAHSHCSPSTINRKLAAVGSFYEFHPRHGVECEFLWSLRPGAARGGSWRPLLAHLGEGPQRRREIKLKAPKKTPRTLTAAQIVAVLEACEHLRDRFLFALLAGAGLRIGEALGLRHEDIDTAGGLIRVQPRGNVNGARAKTGPRDIPVAAGLLRLYADYLFDEYGALDSDYVFVNLWAAPIGAPMGYWTVTDLVARIRNRTDLVFTPHWFRHTYATELLRRGVPAEVVQKLLGHASVATTIDTYEHLEVEHLRMVLHDAGWLSDPSQVTALAGERR
ncbi:tyrosine-type recombinase/integrase [Kribbella sp. NPDC049227]|uniref:tyrosine-type recombinase/integrase n=1 Tax=Kribbella sp. NPDC049227 TaxID=3364113 RepID=UPI003724723E